MTTEEQLARHQYALQLVNKFIIKKHPELATELANDLFKDLEVNEGAPWVGYSIILALLDYEHLNNGIVDTVLAVSKDSVTRHK